MAEVQRQEDEDERRQAARDARRDAAVARGQPDEQPHADEGHDHDHYHEGHEEHGHDHTHDHAHDHEHHGDSHEPHDHDHHDHHAETHDGDQHPDALPLAFIPPAITSAPLTDEETDEEEGHDAPPAADVYTPPEAPTEISPDAPPAELPAEGEAAAPPKPTTVETVGGEEEEEEEEAAEDKQRRRFVASRHYKIQEVIKRRQIMLIQVVKEERGNKGAALTTYLSLAGRYCVLMPNSPRGGGVSRKITSAQDRRRLKAILADLELPKNMAVILRTAGAERNKAEVKRDYEYLQRTWNSIREITMTSRAPALIHEEASLIKRAIRDIYSRDIEEVWVEGEEGYKVGKDFMKMLTPSHAKKVQRYKDDIIPLFHRYQVESQMEAINSPVVQLRSGGSIVFAQTEALVAIDVNSGRATKERHIEETAYKTNCEAADEIARQLRLRDLAGLVVIDFIDMEDNRNNHSVERRLKEALKVDRARIQVGRISHFGLLELSRQRLRPSLIEANFRTCSHCAGSGMVRSTESAAVYALRMLEEEGVRQRSSEVTITVHPDVALYLLNYKREALASIESRYRIRIIVLADPALVPPNHRLDRIKAVRRDGEEEHTPLRELPRPEPVAAAPEENEDETEEEEEDAPETSRETRHQDSRPPRDEGRSENGGRKRRRRRRRGGGEKGEREPRPHDGAPQGDVAQQAGDEGAQQNWQTPGEDAQGEGQGRPAREAQPRDGQPRDGQPRDGQPREGSDGEIRRGRRRGRRGGRRRRRGPGENGPLEQGQGEHTPGENSFAGQNTQGENSGDGSFSSGNSSGDSNGAPSQSWEN
ncbi:MAG: Rne/Rng family ribonuclease, partial [Rhodospirillaceae bacterium]|nr:Rne/Rng family ribonuclease [Rhodospirillaceae bacterium]